MLDAARIRHLTFDCYGTLIDWETGILRAIRPVLSVRGKRPTDAEVLRVYAALERKAQAGTYAPYWEILRTVMRGVGEHFGARLEEREIDRLPESVARWRPFPETAESLRALGRDHTISILSNIDDEMFAQAAVHLGVTLERVVTAEYCRSYKPDPRHFRVALALLDAEPGSVLHVAESRFHDIEPASALGIPTAWVHRASRFHEPGSDPVSASGPPRAKGEPAPTVEVPDLRTLVSIVERGGK